MSTIRPGRIVERNEAATPCNSPVTVSKSRLFLEVDQVAHTQLNLKVSFCSYALQDFLRLLSPLGALGATESRMSPSLTRSSSGERVFDLISLTPFPSPSGFSSLPLPPRCRSGELRRQHARRFRMWFSIETHSPFARPLGVPCSFLAGQSRSNEPSPHWCSNSLRAAPTSLPPCCWNTARALSAGSSASAFAITRDRPRLSTS